MISLPRERRHFLAILFWGIVFLTLFSACASPRISQSDATISVSVSADGAIGQFVVPAGFTVAQALETAGIILDLQDRAEPQAYVTLSDGDVVRVTRVRVESVVSTEIVPYQSQVVRNENLPAERSILIQAGRNGLQEIVYEVRYENGLEVSRRALPSVAVSEPRTEIIMIGVQNPFTPLPLSGRLAYLADGNAWVMEDTTGNRRAVISGDNLTRFGKLDGRVFSLSPDGNWLLFTRKSEKPAHEEINTLWVVSLSQPNAIPVNLKVSNIIHFADWDPKNALRRIAYSTVEPRLQAPGWQANNDLLLLNINADGTPGKTTRVLEAGAGGIYGWWGTNFVWSLDGKKLAFSRPDGIGLVDIEDKTQQSRMELVPFQTGADWALVPGLSWGAGGEFLYFVVHAAPPALVAPEQSPFFDLIAYSTKSGLEINLEQKTGMFAYPNAYLGTSAGAESDTLIAYLQAIQPEKSNASRYRLFLMDSDGSNRRGVFPPEGSLGLEPQTVVWSPAPIGENENIFLAVIYQGNLWLVDASTGNYRQVTGDGQIAKLDWR